MHMTVTFDIGICAYNEEANIGKLLQNLLTQQLDRDFRLNKVIVVASGCTDKTEEIVKDYSKIRSKVKLITEREKKGKASALNIMLDAVQADVLVYLNADVVPAQGSINNMLRYFLDNSVGTVSAKVIPVDDRKKFAGFYSHFFWLFSHFICVNLFVKVQGELCAIRSKLIGKIPWDVPWEDHYFEVITRRQGFRVVYAQDAIVFTKGPGSVADILRWRRRIFTGYMYLRKKYTDWTPTPDLYKVFSFLNEVVNLNDVREVVWTWVIAFLEAIVFLMALIDLKRGYVPAKWQPISSMKNP